MATLRYYHFAAAYVFMAALGVRLYLLFFGNRYERFTDFLPINRRNLRSFWQSLKFYLYLTDEHEWRMGHTVLAGTIYFLLFLAAIVMSLTGLYMLYPDVSWISRMGVALFGSVQMARFIHYILHWCFIFFIIVHLYIAIWNDFKAPEAIISGAFSGSKFMPAEVEED
jgi:Ni/Fe-hydrogenase 1 B-type cytochrome subunit